ncbi:MAG TPA: dihydrodipicolinate synthase family protein [Gammaproteobacteria bacterium]|nr:dihydrodipicolinate synthase family protein [Gammaproteobacteria bacterium]
MDFTRSETKQWALDNVKNWYMCPLTPMTADFKMDEAGIRDNIDQFVDMGIEGLVMGGFIAECWNMKLSDWFRYHEIVADAVAGRTDLWTIILDPSVHQALEKMDFVEKLGFNGAEVINPVVQLRTDDEIFNYFKYMTDHSDLAICLYRTPVSGKVMDFGLMQRLAELETMIGVKQGFLNRQETLKLRQIMPDDFIVMEPLEYWFAEDIRLGGQVCWGELSYILYGKKRHLVREYMELAFAGEHEKARAVSDQLADVREYYGDKFLWVVKETATYATALANMKVWFEAIGLKAGPILPPVDQPTQQQRDEIYSKLDEMGVR